MSDDKKKTGGGDRRRVAANEGYEVKYFASKHKISMAEAREIIARVGGDREAQCGSCQGKTGLMAGLAA